MISQTVQLVGAALILIPFMLAQRQILKPTDLRYLLMNVGGSLILTTLAAIAHQWGFTLLNAVWAADSIIHLLQHRKQRKRASMA